MKKIISIFAFIILSISSMSAQSLYNTWRGMRMADETMSVWVYITFIRETSTFAIALEASFATEDFSFDVNTRGLGSFSYDGSRLNIMLDESMTKSTLENVIYSDTMERQFRRGELQRTDMNSQILRLFQQNKKPLEAALNELGGQFRNCRVLNITSQNLYLQMGLGDDAKIEEFDKDNDYPWG